MVLGDPLDFLPSAEIITEFLADAARLIERCNQALLELDKDLGNHACLQQLLGDYHTLKGTSGTLGHRRMRTFVHQIEDVLLPIRDAGKPLTREIIDRVLECNDVLQKFCEEIDAGTDAGIDVDSPLRRLREVTEEEKGPVETVSARPAPLPESSPSGTLLRICVVDPNFSYAPGDEGLIREARGIFGRKLITGLRSLGKLSYSEPPAEAIENGDVRAVITVALTCDLPTAALVKKIRRLSADIRGVEVAETAPASPEPRPAREPEPGEPATEQRPAPPPEPIILDRGPTRHRDRDTFIQVSESRIARTLALIGEVILDENRLSSAGRQLEAELGDRPSVMTILESVERLHRAVRQLHEELTKTQLVPISTITGPLARDVRQTSRDLGKQIEYEVLGADTEIERGVTETLKRMFGHIIRNSIGHGIELPQERRNAGKPETGRIQIHARIEQGHLRIAITDDGRGIDPQRVREAAIRKELIAPEKAARLTNEEAVDLIFLPGFSTANVQSELSGRGVGLDVVRREIENLKGTVAVATTVGQGTRFDITIPVNSAILQALLVAVQETIVAIPLPSVLTVQSIRLADRISGPTGPSIPYQNRLIPVVHLGQIFATQETDQTGDDLADEQDTVIVGVGEFRAALLVSSLLDEQSIVVRPLRRFLGHVRGVNGATILPDGTVAPILDVAGIVHTHTRVAGVPDRFSEANN